MHMILRICAAVVYLTGTCSWRVCEAHNCTTIARHVHDLKEGTVVLASDKGNKQG